jgi:hypothetical protein
MKHDVTRYSEMLLMSMPDTSSESPRPAPIVRTARGIAEALGCISERQAQNLLDRGLIKSARKVGHQWYAPREALLREFGCEP